MALRHLERQNYDTFCNTFLPRIFRTLRMTLHTHMRPVNAHIDAKHLPKQHFAKQFWILEATKHEHLTALQVPRPSVSA